MTLEIATPGSVIVTGGRRHGVALNHVKLVSPNFVVTELGIAFTFLGFLEFKFTIHRKDIIRHINVRYIAHISFTTRAFFF